MHAIAISLKIPDNTAYTALVALRRLGVDVYRIERSDVWLYPDESDLAQLTARVTGDETIFNPNKHRLNVLERAAPRRGEVWIESLTGAGAGPAAVAWRLLDAHGAPVSQAVLDAAVERLLFNPAIDRAIISHGANEDRDIPTAGQ
jgi:hypothetical protein